MSQSAEKVDTQAIEKLSRRKAATASRVADLDRERGEAKQMLDDLEKNRKAAVFGALDSIKKRYSSTSSRRSSSATWSFSKARRGPRRRTTFGAWSMASSASSASNSTLSRRNGSCTSYSGTSFDTGRSTS